MRLVSEFTVNSHRPTVKLRRDGVWRCKLAIRNRNVVRGGLAPMAEFHDTDTDILASILADSPDTRTSCTNLVNFRRIISEFTLLKRAIFAASRRGGGSSRECRGVGVVVGVVECDSALRVVECGLFAALADTASSRHVPTGLRAYPRFFST